MVISKKPGGRTVYQIKVTLKGIRPPVWRRFQTLSDISLHSLHEILQVVMGWTNSHLYRFEIAGRQFCDPNPEYGTDMKDAGRAKLRQVAPGEKMKFTYEYDFGDGWLHEVQVEKVLAIEPGEQYPICLAGKRACPPEDCGGIVGYAELLEIIDNPAHERYEEMMDWLGGGFDPPEFDLYGVNEKLRSVKGSAAVGEAKIGRNDPCPCGSGKKYKKCCGLKETHEPLIPPSLRTGTSYDDYLEVLAIVAMYGEKVRRFEKTEGS